MSQRNASPAAFQLHINTHPACAHNGMVEKSGVRLYTVSSPDESKYDSPAEEKSKGFLRYVDLDLGIDVFTVRGNGGEPTTAHECVSAVAFPNKTDVPDEILLGYASDRLRAEIQIAFWDVERLERLYKAGACLRETCEVMYQTPKQIALGKYLPVLLEEVLSRTTNVSTEQHRRLYLLRAA